MNSRHFSCALQLQVLIVTFVLMLTTPIFASIDAVKKAFNNKDFTKAYSLIQSNLKDQTKDADILLLAGDIYIEVNKLDSALILYKNASKLQEANYGIDRKIGQLFIRKKDFKSALTFLLKAVKANEKDPWNHLAYADGLLASGKTAEAEKSYLEAKKLNNRLWQASASLAGIAMQKNNVEAAKMHYEDALKIDPSNIDIRKKHVLLVKDDKEPDPTVDETIAVNKQPFVDGTLIQSNLVYPELAKKAGIEGKVTLRVLIRKNGKAKKFIVETTDSELFNKSAGDAVMKSQFLPALQNGKPIACWLSVPISFKIK